MTVENLIDELKRCDADSEVRVSGSYGATSDIDDVNNVIDKLKCNLGHEHSRSTVWIRTSLMTG